MRRRALIGVAAGSAGTAALNIVTYADMALRGRPSSEVPAEIAGKLAEGIGVDLAAAQQTGDQQNAQNMQNTQEKARQRAQHRRTGLGSLLGYATGLGLGTIYGLVRPYLGETPVALAGVALGLAAMAASDVPATVTGVTNPAKWSPSSWAADVIPHLAYGLVTTATYEALMHE